MRSLTPTLHSGHQFPCWMGVLLLRLEQDEQGGSGDQDRRHDHEAQAEVLEGDADEAPLAPHPGAGALVAPTTTDANVLDAADGHCGSGFYGRGRGSQKRGGSRVSCRNPLPEHAPQQLHHPLVP